MFGYPLPPPVNRVRKMWTEERGDRRAVTMDVLNNSTLQDLSNDLYLAFCIGHLSEPVSDNNDNNNNNNNNSMSQMGQMGPPHLQNPLPNPPMFPTAAAPSPPTNAMSPRLTSSHQHVYSHPPGVLPQQQQQHQPLYQQQLRQFQFDSAMSDDASTLKACKELISEVSLSGSQRVCSVAFRPGDIVWNCKQCQKDDTCVLCQTCFTNSQHEGHDVFFYQVMTTGGGCCDCGDPDAWDTKGFCSDHGTSKATAADPEDALPLALVTSTRQVFDAVVDWLVFQCQQPTAVLVVHHLPLVHPRFYHSLVAEIFQRMYTMGAELDAWIQQQNERVEQVNARNRHSSGSAGSTDTSTNFNTALGGTNTTPGNSSGEMTPDVVDSSEPEAPAYTSTNNDREFVLTEVNSANEAHLLQILERKFSGPGSPVELKHSESLHGRDRMVIVIEWLVEVCQKSDGLSRLLCKALTEGTGVLEQPKPTSGSSGSGSEGGVPDRRVSPVHSPVASLFGSTSMSSPAQPPLAHPFSPWTTTAGPAPSSSQQQQQQHLNFDSTGRVFRGNGHSNMYQTQQQQAQNLNRVELAAEAAAEEVHRYGKLGSLMVNDVHLLEEVSIALHRMYMRLLVDGVFKERYAIAFARTYREVSREFVSLPPSKKTTHNENTIFGLSVQFLNRASFVETLVFEHGLLESLVCSLLGTLKHATAAVPSTHSGRGGTISAGDGTIVTPRGPRSRRWPLPAPVRALDAVCIGLSARVRTNHQVITSRKYTSTVTDLRYVLQIPGMSRYLCLHRPELFQLWANALASAQLLDEQLRRTDQHVERASEDWVHAFNLNLSLTSIFPYLLQWIQDAPTRGTSERLTAELGDVDTAFGHQEAMFTVVQRSADAVCQWLENGFPAREALQRISAPGGSTSPLGTHLGISFDAATQPVSFHTPLHRFFAFVLRACVSSTLDPAVYRPILRCGSEAFWVGLSHFAMRPLVLAAQIRAQMWRRNGSSMENQLVNYSMVPLCRHSKDLDLAILQLTACHLSPNHFVALLMRAFGIEHWVFAPSLSAHDAVFIPPRPVGVSTPFAIGADSGQPLVSPHPLGTVPRRGQIGDGVVQLVPEPEVRQPDQAMEETGLQDDEEEDADDEDVDIDIDEQTLAGATQQEQEQQFGDHRLAGYSAEGAIDALVAQAQAAVDASGGGGGGGETRVTGPLTDPDMLVPLTESFLSLLVIVVTELPTPSKTATMRRDDKDIDIDCSSSTDFSAVAACRGYLSRLRREVVHRLATSPCAFSVLMECSYTVSTHGTSDATEDELKMVLDEVAILKDSSDGMEAAKFVLKEKSWDLYDPLYYHLPQESHEKAREEWLAKRKLLGDLSRRNNSNNNINNLAMATAVSGEGGLKKGAKAEVDTRGFFPGDVLKDTLLASNVIPIPMVGPPPICHPALAPVRTRVLFSSSLMATLRQIIHDASAPMRFEEARAVALANAAATAAASSPRTRARAPSTASVTGNSRRRRARGVAATVGGGGGAQAGSETAADAALKQAMRRTTSTLVAIVLQILTLQLHCLTVEESEAAIGYIPIESRSGQNETGDCTYSWEKHAPGVGIAGQNQCGPRTMQDRRTFLVSELLLEQTNSSDDNENKMADATDVDADKSKAVKPTANKHLDCMLGDLLKLWHANSPIEEGNRESLRWILMTIGGLNEVCLIRMRAAWQGTSGRKRALDKASRKRKAQMTAMRKQQDAMKAFAAQMDDMEGLEDGDNDMDTAAGREGGGEAEEGSNGTKGNDAAGASARAADQRMLLNMPPCVSCREMVNKPIGYIGFAQRSCVLTPDSQESLVQWGEHQSRVMVHQCGHAIHFACWDAYYASLASDSWNSLVVDLWERGEFMCPLCKSLSNIIVPCVPAHILGDTITPLARRPISPLNNQTTNTGSLSSASGMEVETPAFGESRTAWGAPPQTSWASNNNSIGGGIARALASAAPLVSGVGVATNVAEQQVKQNEERVLIDEACKWLAQEGGFEMASFSQAIAEDANCQDDSAFFKALKEAMKSFAAKCRALVTDAPVGATVREEVDHMETTLSLWAAVSYTTVATQVAATKATNLSAAASLTSMGAEHLLHLLRAAQECPIGYAQPDLFYQFVLFRLNRCLNPCYDAKSTEAKFDALLTMQQQQLQHGSEAANNNATVSFFNHPALSSSPEFLLVVIALCKKELSANLITVLFALKLVQVLLDPVDVRRIVCNSLDEHKPNLAGTNVDGAADSSTGAIPISGSISSSFGGGAGGGASLMATSQASSFGRPRSTTQPSSLLAGDGDMQSGTVGSSSSEELDRQHDFMLGLDSMTDAQVNEEADAMLSIREHVLKVVLGQYQQDGSAADAATSQYSPVDGGRLILNQFIPQALSNLNYRVIGTDSVTGWTDKRDMLRSVRGGLLSFLQVVHLLLNSFQNRSSANVAAVYDDLVAATGAPSCISVAASPAMTSVVRGWSIGGAAQVARVAMSLTNSYHTNGKASQLSVQRPRHALQPLYLVPLPQSYTELYAAAHTGECVKCKKSAHDRAICLICGQVLVAGGDCNRNNESGMGECTTHVAEAHAGIGLIFLLQRCNVLLIRGVRAAYWPSMFVDRHRETHRGTHRGLPMFLDQHRYERVQQLWLSHQIPAEVTRKRNKATAVVRDHYY